MIRYGVCIGQFQKLTDLTATGLTMYLELMIDFDFSVIQLLCLSLKLKLCFDCF